MTLHNQRGGALNVRGTLQGLRPPVKAETPRGYWENVPEETKGGICRNTAKSL